MCYLEDNTADKLNDLNAVPVIQGYKVVDLTVEIDGDEVMITTLPDLCAELGIDPNNIGQVEDEGGMWCPFVRPNPDVALPAYWLEGNEEWY